MTSPPFRQVHFFKHFFQIRELALEHVQDYIPTSIVRHLDLSIFELDTTNYINPELSETRSDVVYRTCLNNGRDLRLALLDEHKSEQPDRDVRFQILTYKNSIWLEDEKQDRRPTFILPSVIYHGRTNWKKEPFLHSFQGLPASLVRYLDDFDYLLLNLRNLKDEEILRRSGGKMIASAFLALKHAFQPKYFWENFAKVANFDWQRYPKPVWENFYTGLLHYMGSIAGLKRKDFAQLAKPLPSTLNHFVMTVPTIPSIFEEGLEEGLEKGLQKGLQKGILIGAQQEAERKARQFVTSLIQELPDLSDVRIAALAGVTKSFVANIRQELKKAHKN